MGTKIKMNIKLLNYNKCNNYAKTTDQRNQNNNCATTELVIKYIVIIIKS